MFCCVNLFADYSRKVGPVLNHLCQRKVIRCAEEDTSAVVTDGNFLTEERVIADIDDHAFHPLCQT